MAGDPLLSVHFLHGETKKPVGTYVCEAWGLIIVENSCTVAAC